MKLSDAKCRSARPAEANYKLADGHGLYLFVKTNGARLWRYDYRHGGKRLTMSFGSYPDIALADARDACDAARRKVRDGLDPMKGRKTIQAAAALARATTFGLIADELLAKLELEQKADVTVSKRRWLLKDLAADLQDRPVAEISPAEVLVVLREVEGRGQLETARRLRAAIGQVLRLAVATGRATTDFTPALRGAIATPKTTHRAAITDPTGAKRLVTAIATYDRRVVRSAMQAMLYCFPRPGECRQASWPEVDLAAKVWTIPAERTKMRREHRIPLSRQACTVFEELKDETFHDGQGLCFPGQRSLQRPISENTICVALRTLGFAKDEMSAHGFRALASSLLNEQSPFSADTIERALAHQEPNAIRRAYARGQHWDDRVRMMQWWADYLDGLAGISSSRAA